MILNKKKILAVPNDYWACGQYRVIQPYRDMALRYNSMTKYDFKLLMPREGVPVNLSVFDKYDVIFLQRIIDTPLLEIAKKLKQMGKVVIQEIDDDVYNVDTRNPFHLAMKGKKYKDIFRSSLKYCDYIHTTTKEIKNNLIEKNNYKPENIHVFPNAVDTSHPLIHQSRRSELPQDKIVFGWQGGSSHGIDMKYINFVSIILDKYPNTVFAFCSNKKLFTDHFGDLKRKYKERIIFIEPVQDNFDKFPSIPSMFDIGLAPLAVNDFNNAKSYLKCLEYGIHGVPTICSPSNGYLEFNDISSGCNLIAKDNKKENWVEHIDYLIKDEQYKDRGARAKQYILDNLTLSKINRDRFNFYMSII